jgi:hypothetical protein
MPTLHKRFAFTFRGEMSSGLLALLEPNIIESCEDPDGMWYCFMGVQKPVRPRMFVACVEMWNKSHEGEKIHILGDVEVFSKACRASDSPILKRIRVERFKTYSGSESTYRFWVAGDKVAAIGKSEDSKCIGKTEEVVEDVVEDIVEDNSKLAAKALAKHAEALVSHARMFHIQSRIVAAGGSLDTAKDVLLAAQEHVRKAEARVLDALGSPADAHGSARVEN